MTECTSIQVTLGVDTHKDAHVAAAKDQLGRPLGDCKVPTTPAGYAELLAWGRQFGEVVAVGIEGPGCYGAGLARYFTDAGVTVVEVGRPDRQRRARRGKSDTLDAEAAAMAVLAGDGLGTPKAADGPVEMLRVLRIARASAVKARTVAMMNMRDLVITAPDALRAELDGLPAKRLVAVSAARETPRVLATPADATWAALGGLARRWQALDAEARSLAAQVETLVTQACPKLLDAHGVGPDVAATLLEAVGDNPGRLRSEAALAKLCGVAPLEASSGKIVRHRLNRGGNRQANRALHVVVVVRMRRHQPTRDYLQRRLAEGKTKKEIMRCLKRYVVREIYAAMQPDGQPASPAVAA